MNSLIICALVLYHYDADLEMSFHKTRHQAETRAINYYSENYQKHFTSIEQIEDYNYNEETDMHTSIECQQVQD